MRIFIYTIIILSVFSCTLKGRSDYKINKGGAESKNVSSDVKLATVVDHKGLAFGKEVPDWVLQDERDLNAQDKFKGFYLFKIESPEGRNLEGVTTWSQNYQINSEIAKILETKVESKFAGSVVGDLNRVESYMENVVSAISRASYAGLRRESDWWIKKRVFEANNTSKDVYVYYALYIIPRETIDRQIQSALNQANATPAANPEEARARENVRNAFNSSIFE